MSCEPPVDILQIIPQRDSAGQRDWNVNLPTERLSSHTESRLGSLD